MVRDGGAVSGRTENGGVVLSPVTRESTRRTRTGGDVLTKERLKEKEPERRGDGGGEEGGAVTRRVGERTRRDSREERRN